MLQVCYCPFHYRNLKYLRILVLVRNVQSWKNTKVVKSQLGKETKIKKNVRDGKIDNKVKVKLVVSSQKYQLYYQNNFNMTCT